jgi:hypothetical protein
MTFKTQSGSVYEVDHAQSRVRRLSGTHDPTNSQGADGEWRQYYSALVELGYSAYFQWNKDDSKATITSPVVEIDGCLDSSLKN